ncbi:MAG: ABC transporter substrate-binding protein [Campylobacterales bacterium]|nr:ABC transporter substrate-binding protein [Campylobacterales bacterium]
MKKITILLIFSIYLFGYERVVALSPSINEIIFALNCGDKIIGNTNCCKYPIESIQKIKVGGYFSPSLEKIISLKPDLVILQENSSDFDKKLNKVGIETKVVKINSLESIKTAILDIGTIFNNQQKAKEIVQKIDNSIINLKGIVENKKILISIGYNLELSKEIYAVGQNLYFNDIIKASGNQNAIDESSKGQPVLNFEKILKLNPDIVIILAPMMEEKNISTQQLISPWLKLPINAGKSKSIFVQYHEYSGIPSDRVVNFIDDFRGFLSAVKNR